MRIGTAIHGVRLQSGVNFDRVRGEARRRSDGSRWLTSNATNLARKLADHGAINWPCLWSRGLISWSLAASLSIAHGYIRFTQDLDILPSPASDEYAALLARALTELQAVAIGATGRAASAST